MVGLAPDTPVDEVIKRTYRLLSEAPSMILSATLDDYERRAQRAEEQRWRIEIVRLEAAKAAFAERSST
jgi:hypothetical protein